MVHIIIKNIHSLCTKSQTDFFYNFRRVNWFLSPCFILLSLQNSFVVYLNGLALLAHLGP